MRFKWSLRVVALALAVLLFFPSAALAALPNNTIVFGPKAYDLSLLDDVSLVNEILAAFVANGNSFAYKMPAGNFIDPNAQAVDPAMLPAVSYLDAAKVRTGYQAGDGDVVPIDGGEAMSTVVVAAAYNTEMNGGRHIVKLANGNIIAIAWAATSTTYFYKSTDNGGTFAQMCYITDCMPYAAITSLGNVVYLLFTDAAQLNVYSLTIDTTTVANADQNASKVTVDTQAALVSSMSISNDGTDLHAAWISKNVTYPDSWNVRYSKYTVATTSWAAPTQLTMDNTAGTHNTQPCIAISNSKPIVAFRWTDATNNKINCQYYTAAWHASTIKDGTTYLHARPSMVVESTNHIVCFYEGRDVTDAAKYNIRCSESTDGGETWGAETKLTSGNTYDQQYPSAGIASTALDDIYLYFTGQDAGSGGFNQVRRMIRASASWGAVSDLTAYDAGGTSNVQAMAAEVANTIGYIWMNAHDGRVDFDKETFNVAPNAPTGLTRANFDATAAATFSWTFSDDNPGDTQSAYKIKLREIGTGTWYYAKSDGTIWTTDAWIASATSSFAMSATQLTNEKQYEWYVATKDAAGAIGPYSSQATFYTSAVPTCAIVYPADAGTHTTSSITVTWSFAHTGSETQKKYQARLTDNADAELYTSGEVTDATATSKTIIYTLVTGTTYKLKVKVESTKDLWGTEHVHTFVTSFTPPPTPTIVVTGVDASAYIRIVIENHHQMDEDTEGDDLTLSGGATASGTDAILDGHDEQAAKAAITTCGAGTYRLTATAKDSAQVADDLKLWIWNNTDGVEAIAAVTFTCTAIDAAYTLDWVAEAAHSYEARVIKDTPTANTITLNKINLASMPIISSNDIYRRVSGDTAWTRIKVGTAEDGTYDDYHVATVTTYEYKARAIGSTGTTADSATGSESVTLTGIWLHNVTDAVGTIKHFIYDGPSSADWQADLVLMQFAGRMKPVAEFGESAQGRVTAQILCPRTGTNYADLRTLGRLKATVCYRDRVRLMFGVVGRLPEADEFYPLNPTLTLEVLEIDFDEEV